MSVSIIAAAALLISAFITDIRRMIIPNKLTAFFFAAGLIYHLVASGWGGGGSALLGAAAGAIPLLLLYAAKGIGAGDVKLFGALGAWVGPSAALYVLMYSILYAGAIGLVMLFISRPFTRRVFTGAVSLFVPGMGLSQAGWLSWAKEGKKFPFMLAVVPGALSAWWTML
ncbi:prepilin peptidase [Paenibacillus thailandensis]|uniref:Prepilin peptidase n=1 Tax=Paenibacillus thailandensis TaxID=393250 RepID=A0ABW5QWH0_9BACL